MIDRFRVSIDSACPWPQSTCVRLCACAVLLAGISFGGVALAQGTSSEPDCQCRAPDGQMRDLGTVECVDIVGTRKLVSCVMSTNTPYWKTVEGVQGCPEA